MDRDDRMIGRLLTRREALAVLGSTGLAALMASCAPEELEQVLATVGPATEPASPTEAATAAAEAGGEVALPSCVVRPELTEGPYFVDERLNRSDIRSDPASGAVSEGAPLELTFQVSEVGTAGCTPREGDFVDIWHCDARGVYSGVTDPGFSTTGEMFLRGYQVTDSNGRANFTTIYPGWYPGRAVHIHFKIRSELDANSSYEFTSQLFFDEAMTDVVHALEPYASKGVRTLLNEGDGIYRQGGPQLLLDVQKGGPGYQAAFDIGVQLS